MKGAWPEGKPSPHSVLCFAQVLYQQTSAQYLTVSKGGAVLVWDEDMSPLHTRQLQSRVASKDLWVTDVVLLPSANQVTFTPSVRLSAALRLQPTLFFLFLCWRRSIATKNKLPHFCAKLP